MGAGSPLKREPHLPQKANPSGLAKPHDGQSKVSLAPQRPQNAMSGGVSNAQRGQIISGRRAMTARCQGDQRVVLKIPSLAPVPPLRVADLTDEPSGFPPLRWGRLPLDRGQPIERVNQFLGLPGSRTAPELGKYNRRMANDEGISDGAQDLLA